MARLFSPTPGRTCKHCGAQLKRKRYPNGDYENREQFIRRKFCDLLCYGKAVVAEKGKATA